MVVELGATTVAVQPTVYPAATLAFAGTMAVDTIVGVVTGTGDVVAVVVWGIRLHNTLSHRRHSRYVRMSNKHNVSLGSVSILRALNHLVSDILEFEISRSDGETSEIAVSRQHILSPHHLSVFAFSSPDDPILYVFGSGG